MPDRSRYVVLAIATIVIGLAVYLYGSRLSPAPRDTLGDVLWAAMIVWLISAIAPRTKLSVRCAVAFAFCVVIELSQLYHAPAIDTLRSATIGHLVLGSGFDPRDLFAYACGVVAAAAIDALLRARRT